MGPDVPYFNILLCLMPDDFTRHEESATTQWVSILVHTLSWQIYKKMVYNNETIIKINRIDGLETH
jgi:hypothetical protein